MFAVRTTDEELLLIVLSKKCFFFASVNFPICDIFFFRNKGERKRRERQQETTRRTIFLNCLSIVFSPPLLCLSQNIISQLATFFSYYGLTSKYFSVLLILVIPFLYTSLTVKPTPTNSYCNFYRRLIYKIHTHKHTY